MRNTYMTAMLTGLGVKMKKPLPHDARTAVDSELSSPARGEAAKPRGTAAAAAQDAWETL